MKKNKFKVFHDKFPYFNIEETIEFYSIFDGHPFLEYLKLDHDLFTCIQLHVIDRIDELRPYFLYDENQNFQEDLESMLIRLAIGDRKNYTIFKKENITQMRGHNLYKSLFEKNIIIKEKSREKPKREYKGQVIKKSLRNYEVQDKIHFTNNFTRFWFTFVAPHLKKSLHVDKDILLKNITQGIESYISLCFEELSNQLLIHKYQMKNIKNYGSYWDNKSEIDLLIEVKDGTIIAGETKWKNHKVCRSVLRKLQNKCEKMNIGATYFVLCSKSGFSKELKNNKNENVLLFELKDFEELL
jgi:hypothetical protein